MNPSAWIESTAPSICSTLMNPQPRSMYPAHSPARGAAGASPIKKLARLPDPLLPSPDEGDEREGARAPTRPPPTRRRRILTRQARASRARERPRAAVARRHRVDIFERIFHAPRHASVEVLGRVEPGRPGRLLRARAHGASAVRRRRARGDGGGERASGGEHRRAIEAWSAGARESDSLSRSVFDLFMYEGRRAIAVVSGPECPNCV